MKHRRALSVTLAAILSLQAVSLSSDAAESNAGVLGVFRGSGKPDQVAKYEDWLGRPMSYAVDFVGRASTTSNDPWATIDDPSWVCRQWRAASSKLVLSTAMLPTTRFSLASGAEGQYDDHWKLFGQSLVANGCQDAIIRLGWEFNGKFYPWAAAGKEASFVAYWRRIVTVLRKVPNQHFQFDWCPLAGVSHADVEAAWPGSSYVDFIGLDAYDTAPESMVDPAKRWSHQLSRPYGLNWLERFAKDQGLPMSIPEWAVTNRPNDNLGGGDNSYYITKMWNWIQSHDVVYASYFEDNAADGSHRLMTDEFPKASAEYRRLVRAG